MRIIICDDDPAFLKEIGGYIEKYFACRENRKLSLQKALSGRELLEMMAVSPADAIFLDIDMPGPDGFETAGIVKKQYPDCILIFCTCHNELVYDSFEYEPFWFLCKDSVREKTDLVLEKMVRKADDARREYTVRTKTGIIRVRHIDLIYAEVEKHKVRLHLPDDTVEFRGRLSDTAEKLKNYDFVQINSGCVVNLEWVSRIRGSDLSLRNGEVLAVSRGSRKQVKEAFYNYLERV